MEMLIIVAIWTVVVKRGVEDIWHTARGGTPPRLAAAKARRSSGAAGRYWGTLWDDTFDDLLSRHNEKRARRDSKPARPEGNPHYARTALRGIWDDASMWGRQTWRDGWRRVEQKRQAKRLRSRPGQQTVPGKVVPNRDEAQDGPQDETQDRPQDETGPEPRTVPTPDGGTDLEFGDDPTDPTGTKQCPECRGTGLVDGEVCLSCRDRQEQRNQHHDNQSAPDSPDSGPNQDIAPPHDPTTQEGPTTMTTTMPTDTEVVSLNKAIDYSESTARVAAEMVNSIDFTQASLAAGGVTGIAVESFSTAKENFGTIAAAMERAANEFKAQLAIQEQYAANPGAGSKEFIMGTR